MQLKEAERLIASHPPGSAEFDSGLELLRHSAAVGSSAAELMLGHVYSQVHALPDAQRQAVSWYQRAAEHGEHQAYSRLADLYMIGRGVPQDDAEAFRLYGLTAARGYAAMQCNLAYMLAEGIGCEADDRKAVGWYLRAAAQGEPRAYFNLGLAFHEGRGVPRDPVPAWAWMESARRQQYWCSGAESARIAAGMSASQVSDARKLVDRIDENFMALQRVLERDPSVLSSAERYRSLVEANFAMLAVPALSLDERVRPAGDGSVRRHMHAAPEPIATDPNIFTVDEFVSVSECAHLMSSADHSFVPADRITGEALSQESQAFNGNMAAFQTTLCDAVVRNVERRVGHVFGLPSSHVEPVSVLRYEPGHRYAAHVDYFDAGRLEDIRSKGDHAGQRVASFLVYLQPPEAGGETHYLKVGRKVTGRERMALCHFNCLPSGEPDPATLHTGEAVVRGEKWLARTTVREKSFY